MSTWVNVAPREEFPPGAFRSIEIDGTEVAVFNLGGTFYAIENVCTHDGGTLSGGTVEGEQVICPRHGARFSIITGQALGPPAYEPVAIFPVRLENGMVQVRDGRWES